MTFKQHAITIGIGVAVASLIASTWLASAAYGVQDATSDALGLGILLATFALGTYAKIYQIGWREVLFILVANSLAMAARVRFGIPHGVLEVYGWVIAQIYVLFFWAARRKLKKKEGAESRHPAVPDSGPSSES